MAKNLSNVGFVLPVERVSRKFARRIDTASNKTATISNTGSAEKKTKLPVKSWIGASSKDVEIFGYGTHTRNTIIVRTKARTSLAMAAELSNRSHFTEARKWVRDAQMDLMAITPNQQKFAAAKEDLSKRIKGVSLRGYKTVNGWMFAIAMAIQKDGQALPVDHLLPAFDA